MSSLAAPLRRAWWRCVAVFTVLVGLFLMHGISPTVGGCHGGAGGMTAAMPAASAASLGAATSADRVASMPDEHSASITGAVFRSADGAVGSASAADSCIPLRPESPGTALLTLLALGLAHTLWLRVAEQASPTARQRRRSRHRPQAGGSVPLLVHLCISRT
jgi:hypothetical protein